MSIFKYFTEEAHARALLNKGQMLFRPLSYFRAYEDDQVRGDAREGTLIYAPTTGLEITKQDGTVLSLENTRFTSAAMDNEIFVYCASNRLTSELADRFQSLYCIEVTDPDRIAARLRARACAASQLDYENLRSASVEYRKNDQKPEADWALPERLAFIKSDSFAWQDEYRLAIGRRGAFDVYNVACALESGASPPRRSSYVDSELLLRVGNIEEFARLHRL